MVTPQASIQVYHVYQMILYKKVKYDLVASQQICVMYDPSFRAPEKTLIKAVKKRKLI
jgi:hypothetical protein